MSPDINPIEHLWDELDRRVRRQEEAPANHRDLLQALQEEWDTIPQQDIRHLIQSMPRRCRAVVAAQGSHTPY
ncbi:hypothetical protein V1264_009201 [Littorina saxatilis]|uniref:Tc1-like transposase DDE domain-containing protein n=1 Tax=Littorina saxatilis TaxID=31220 RepID=A0AAN9G2F3_9CAEN